MANNWYLCKISYNGIDEKGNEKKITQQCLVDAMSYSEAETRAFKEAESVIFGEFSIKKITRTNVTEIHKYHGSEKLYKCKVIYVDIDKKSGKEKKAISNIMIQANNIKEAEERLMKVLSVMIAPYVVFSIVETSIIKIYEYAPENNKQIK